MAKRDDKLERRSPQVKSDTIDSVKEPKPPLKDRHFKVRESSYDYQYTGSYRRYKPTPPPVPWINLKGYWLEQAGFPIGSKLHASIKPGEITLTLVETDLSPEKTDRW